MLTIDFGFRELEIFCKVVELESFSRATAAVFLVQASVSERIASLFEAHRFPWKTCRRISAKPYLPWVRPNSRTLPRFLLDDGRSY